MELKVQTGADLHFVWKSPAYVSGAPTLTIDGAPGPALGLIHADVAILEASAHLLTAAAPVADTQGVTGDRGDAYFWTDAEGTIPVRVQDIESDEVFVAEALRGNLGAGTLQWATWEVVIPAATLGAARRNIDVQISYVTQSIAGEDQPRVDRGLIHVVDHVFDTGLTHLVFVERLPGFSENQHTRLNSYAGPIALALDELLEDFVRPAMQPYGLHEDDIISSGRFLRAHIYLTQAAVYDDVPGRSEDADKARERGAAAAANVLESIVADLDGDGEIDDPAAVGSSPTLFAGGGGFPDCRIFSDPTSGSC